MEANRAALDQQGVPSAFHLNALRHPGLWDRLSKLPRRKWQAGEGRRQLEALAKEAGLALEEAPDPWPIPGLRRGMRLRWHDCVTRQGSYLDHLEWAVADAGFDAILEADRIRLFDRRRALAEWRAWAK